MQFVLKKVISQFKDDLAYITWLLKVQLAGAGILVVYIWSFLFLEVRHSI